MTAQISQRTLLLILPLVFASFVTGTVAVFEQVGDFFRDDSVSDEDDDEDEDDEDEENLYYCRIRLCLGSSPY